MDSNKVKGYILGSIAAASYGTNPLFALPLYAGGMNPDSVLLLRYAVAIPIVALMIWQRGRSFRVTGRQLAILAVLGVLMALSSLTLFLSYNYMDAGIASTLLFVYPIMVAVIMAAVFKERISKVTIACIAMALCGIGLLYNGDGDSTLSFAGTMIVMASSLSYAIYIVAVNRTGVGHLATLTVTFYVLLFGITLFAGRIAAGQTFVMPRGVLMWGCVLGLAILPTAISFICTTGAIQYIGSTPTAILGALEPVTAVVIGIAVFGEKLTLPNIVGMLLIVAAVSGVIGGSSLTKLLTHRRRMFPRLRRGGKR